MTRWLAPIPAMREEVHDADRRRVRCFSARPRSVHALLEQAAVRNPDGDAVIAGDARLSWRDLLAGSGALAA